MTAATFALLVNTQGCPDEAARARFHAAASAFDLVTHKWDACAQLAIPEGCAEDGASVVVLGRVLPRGLSRPESNRSAARAFAALGPGAFAQAYWGDYIVIAATGQANQPVLARVPFGATPCFWMTRETHLYAASSLAILKAIGGETLQVDWEETACFLLATEMRREATCLAGVRELPGGSALRVDAGGVRSVPFWSPWEVTSVSARIGDPAAAADAVREAVDLAVAGHSAGIDAGVLLLSGGIDSSVVAASLAQAGRTVAALNMVTRERSGDERPYARAVAERLGVTLTERVRSEFALEWDDVTPRRLARPSGRLFRQPTLAAARELAGSIGAGAIFDGGGGDNLFCSLQSVAPLLDRIAVEGLGPAAGATAREIALFADVGLATVWRKAIGRWLNGRVRYRWPIETEFIASPAKDLAARAVAHPWLDPPPGVLPGTAAHVALVLGALALAEDDSTHPAFRTVSPLVSQPVVETVLRVPSWLWLEHGRNRAVVRRAFADRLPRAILERHGKGTPAGFIAEAVFANRRRLRELLGDSLLAANKVIDAVAVVRYLDVVKEPRDFAFARIMQLVDAERWARLWA